MTESDLVAYMAERRARIERALDALLPVVDVEPKQVHAAMRYAVLDGGKRLRPMLSLAVGDLAGWDPDRLLGVACALEFVHTASLILDDLPCMDDAALRRDKPCTHAAFGEATALLGVVGLIALAFDAVASDCEQNGRDACVASATHQLATAIGTGGLIRGQLADLGLTGAPSTLASTEEAHRHKAGDLFVSATVIPALIVGLSPQEVAALETYARALGLAFQIVDDLIDASASGEDAGKSTFVTHLGVAGARRKAVALTQEASEAVSLFGDRAKPLQSLAHYVTARTQ